MSSPQDCFDKLRYLAEVGSGGPRNAAAKIVGDFTGSASKADVSRLRVRLEGTLLVGKWTVVPPAYLDQHGRWRAVLEGACAQVRGPQ